MAVTWSEIAMGTAATLSDTAPSNVGTTAAAGNGNAASRYNHVHALGADCVAAANIADDAVGSEHIEALSAALDFAGNQATDMVIHSASTPPATPVVGKLYYDTDDNKLYVCTSAA